MSADTAKPPDPHADADGMPAEIDALLRDLLVGSRRVRVDPSTGRIIRSDDASKRSTLDRSTGRE